jgi:hypothetical protein
MKEEIAGVEDRGLSILMRETNENALILGDLQPGKGDCLHWLQPGLPDAMVKEIFEWMMTKTQIARPF